MIDHLVMAADKAALVDLIATVHPDWVLTIGNGDRLILPATNPSTVFYPRCGLVPATYGEPDPETGERPVLTPAVYAESTFAWIALPDLDALLRDLPANACRLIADRAANEAGEPFLLHTAADMTDEVLAAAWIEPVGSDSRYPFGAPPADG